MKKEVTVVHFLSRRGGILALLLFAASFGGLRFATARPGAFSRQLKARAGYAELLQRVQQGDMSVDFSAFRSPGNCRRIPHQRG